MLLDYELNTESILASVSEEIARAADAAYAEDGTSLYDEVVNSERDEDIIKGFISDAVRLFAARAYDICRRTADGLEFYVPDFDPSLSDEALSEVTRFIVMSTCRAYFAQKSAALVPEYDQRAQSSLGNAIILLKSRKSPDESWS